MPKQAPWTPITVKALRALASPGNNNHCLLVRGVSFGKARATLWLRDSKTDFKPEATNHASDSFMSGALAFLLIYTRSLAPKIQLPPFFSLPSRFPPQTAGSDKS